MPETERARYQQQLTTYFASLEKRQPQLAKQLFQMIMSLIGSEVLTPEKFKSLEKYMRVGFSLLGDWFQKNDYGGFAVPLSLGERALKAGAGAFLTLPQNRETLLRASGIPESSWSVANQEITQFATTVRQGLQFGFTPKMIVGGLLVENTLTNPSPNTSLTMRDLLIRVSQNQLPQINTIARDWMGK